MLLRMIVIVLGIGLFVCGLVFAWLSMGIAEPHKQALMELLAMVVGGYGLVVAART